MGSTTLNKENNNMSDIHETLLDNYEEAMDMGMSIAEAMKWAKEKTHGYVDHGDIKLSEVDILKRNVADLQQELHEAQIKIKNQREALEDVSKILKAGLKRHEEET
jgi:Asp-tRNA(Asn)/Glu-tRNA(Gln) amidotransferase B subunit